VLFFRALYILYMELIISVSWCLIIEIKRKNARGNCVAGSETFIYLLFKFENATNLLNRL